jgi:hypothetical protein
VLLCVWIGVAPTSFIDKTAGSIDQLIERIDAVRPTESAELPSQQTPTLPHTEGEVR